MLVDAKDAAAHRFFERHACTVGRRGTPLCVAYRDRTAGLGSEKREMSAMHLYTFAPVMPVSNPPKPRYVINWGNTGSQIR